MPLIAGGRFVELVNIAEHRCVRSRTVRGMIPPKSPELAGSERTYPPDLLSSLLMDVFVIPIGSDRYELYCEPSTEIGAAAESEAPHGLVARIQYRFRALLRAAEDRQYGHHPDTDESRTLIGRIQDQAFAWAAQRIAEQRLLWNLRQHTSAVAAHPPDMAYDQVLDLIHRTLHRDYDRHRTWFVVDGIAFLVTFIVLGPFFLLVPGVANIPALYFGFRVVGHWLSMRGAQQGLHRVSWSGRPCPPLKELRDVVTLEEPLRDARVHEIAARLRLQHLTTFFERVAVRHA